MFLRSLWLAVVTIAIASHAAAQCPNTKTQTVPASLTPVGAQGCGIERLVIGGIELGKKMRTCPLLIVDSPAHELIVAGGDDTQVRDTDIVKEWTYFFVCKQVWYVVIPWGSTCVVDRAIVTDTLHRRVTIPCPSNP
tara:strand:- start:50 stop:460 length:411 start_codon:yes stop_codon:yes gene_type:complete